MEDIINSQKFLNAEFEHLKYDVINLTKLDTQKTGFLTNEIQDLKDQLKEQEKIRDDFEQYHRRENLEFHGIPITKNENTNYIIKIIAKKLNIELKESDISTSH